MTTKYEGFKLPPYRTVERQGGKGKYFQFAGPTANLDFARRTLTTIHSEGVIDQHSLEQHLTALGQAEKLVGDIFSEGGILLPNGTFVQKGLQDCPLTEKIQTELDAHTIMCIEVESAIKKYGFDPRTLPGLESLNRKAEVIFIKKGLKSQISYTQTIGGALTFNYHPNDTSANFSPLHTLGKVVFALERNLRSQHENYQPPLSITPKNITEIAFLTLCNTQG